MRPREPLPPLGMPGAAAMLAGVALVQLFPLLPPLWLLAALLALSLVLYLRVVAWRLAGAFVFGIAWAGLHGAWAMSQRLPAAMDGAEYRVEGVVLGLPRRDEDSQRFDLRIDSTQPTALRGRTVRVGW